MAYREFLDESGDLWIAWDTYPQNLDAVLPALRAGWLCFEHGQQRIRYSPVPKQWEEFSADRLRELLKAALEKGGV